MYLCVIDLLDDILREKPLENTQFDNIIVVDNAPKVGPEKLIKFKSLVQKKIFGKFGKIITEYYPIGDDEQFKGYGRTHGMHMFDKLHTCVCSETSDFLLFSCN